MSRTTTDPLGRKIRACLIMNGYSDKDAYTAIGISQSAWYERMNDVGLFRAREIKTLRKMIPGDVCNAISGGKEWKTV